MASRRPPNPPSEPGLAHPQDHAEPVRSDALPRELLVADDGHLTELAAHLWVDGELALLPADLREHCAICPTCEAIVGEAALLSLTAREVVRDGAPAWEAEHGKASPPVELPWRWLAPALVLAIVSGLPSAALSWSSSGNSSSFLSTSKLLLRGLRSLAFSLGHAAEQGFGAPTVFASAALLCGVGVALSIVASRRSLSSGELS
jgi:hypothetical protein